jgi:hypothetical protein
MTGEMGHIYVVHFERPYRHAQHYVGWTTNLRQRFYRHTAESPLRRGSALMRAVVLAGIAFKVVATWPGTRTQERQIHRHHHANRHCPVCRGVVTFADAKDLIQQTHQEKDNGNSG